MVYMINYIFFQTSTTAVLAYVRMAVPALTVSTHTRAPVLQGTLARTAIQVTIFFKHTCNCVRAYVRECLFMRADVLCVRPRPIAYS